MTNQRVDRIKRFFKWAVAEELVPPGSYEALWCVPGLRYGRTNARETEPVKPVPDAWVDAIVPSLSPPVAAIVLLQRLTGARPCEIVLMRACDIDMGAEVWLGLATAAGKNGRPMDLFDYLSSEKDPSGFKFRLHLETQVKMYRFALDRLDQSRITPALCREDVSVWDAVGLKIDGCHCLLGGSAVPKELISTNSFRSVRKRGD